MRITLKTKLLYALGNLGLSIIIGTIYVWTIYFYFPPDNANIPIRIHQGSIFGLLTVIGLIVMTGKLVETFVTPWIANISDNYKNKNGIRIPFFKIYSIPTAISGLLIFFTPFNKEHWLNVIWIAVITIIFFIFFNLYQIPYTSLKSDIGKSKADRLDLSTYSSLAWFIGYAISYSAAIMWDKFESFGIDKIISIRITIFVLFLISTIFLFIPTILIKENVENITVEKNNIYDSLKSVMRHDNFMRFLYADFLYWLAQSIFVGTIVYYVTVLLLMDEKDSWKIIVALGISSFIFYPVVNNLAKRIGKKRLLFYAYTLTVLTFMFCASFGFFNISNLTYIVIFILLYAFPTAVYGIIPGALTSDYANYDSNKTGQSKIAMFFAAKSILNKLATAFGTIISTSILLLGKDISNPLGIRLTAMVSSILMIISLLMIIKYDEL